VLDRLSRAAKGAHAVMLAAEGRSMSSERFARHLEDLMSRHARVAFLVGGAGGFPPGADAIAHERLSLGPLTLPHRLARLVLVEQIYRALSIVHGEPYHK